MVYKVYVPSFGTLNFPETKRIEKSKQQPKAALPQYYSPLQQ